MKFDDILERIGRFGRCQARILFLLCIPQISYSMQIIIVVFLQVTPDHRCRLPTLANDTYEIQDLRHESLVNATIPPGKDGRYDPCRYYLNHSSGNKTLEECDDWVYDTSGHTRTFSMDFQLMCSESNKVNSIQVIFLSGVVLGAIVSGVLADYFGRKPVLIAFCLVHGCGGVGAAFSQSYLAFAIFRFVVGLTTPAIFGTGIVLALELVGPSKRMLAGIAPELAFGAGMVLVTPLAYGIRDWRYLQLAISIPSVLYISYVWLIPESARWLLSRGDFNRAEKVLQWAAMVNKKSLLPGVVDEETLGRKEHVSPLEIRKAPRLLMRILIGMFVLLVSMNNIIYKI